MTWVQIPLSIIRQPDNAARRARNTAKPKILDGGWFEYCY
jgi:hypothetical protein